MQQFHCLRFAFGDSWSLELEYAGGTEGPELPPPEHPYVVACSAEEAPDASLIPAISWRGTEERLFEPIQLRENTEYLIDITIPISRDEATTAWKVRRSWPLPSRLHRYYETDPPKRWSSSGAHLRLAGRLNFSNRVGLADLGLPGCPRLLVEVVCSKLQYFDDYRSLLDEIAEESVNLLLSLDAPTIARLSGSARSAPDLLSAVFTVRHLMRDQRLGGAVERIMSDPHTALVTEESIVPLDRARSMTAPGAAYDGYSHWRKGGPLGRLFGGYTPYQVPESHRYETVDTPENRFVRAFLEEFLFVLETLHSCSVKARKSATTFELAAWKDQVSEWLAEPIWREVGVLANVPSNSQVLQRRAGYQEILGADAALQLGLQLNWHADAADDLEGELRPISKLYELWCFFVLRRTLRELCGPESGTGTLLREAPSGLSWSLREGSTSRLSYTYRSESEPQCDVSLYYNRRFKRVAHEASHWDGSYSASLKPDFSLRLDVKGELNAPQRHWLHFDAKYRLDIAAWRHEVDALDEIAGNEDVGTHGAYQRTDLLKMHTYRDAVLGSRGSYVLFPGDGVDEEIFLRLPNERYPHSSFRVPSVGAFQLRPSSVGTQSDRLRQFLALVLKEIADGRPYHEEVAFCEAVDKA